MQRGERSVGLDYEPGSFRDRDGRVFYQDGIVYRALSAHALAEWQVVHRTRFFREAMEAGRIVARYLALRHPAGPLIRTLVRAVVREDATFHTYRMLEATVQQHQEWGDTEQGGHILIAGARYIAAHSPTQRELLQTADIVQRLHRGEDLHQQ